MSVFSFVPDRDAINKLAERLSALADWYSEILPEYEATVTALREAAAALVALVSRVEETDEDYEKMHARAVAAEARVAVLVSERDELQRERDELVAQIRKVAELRAALSQDVPAATILPLGSAFVPQSDPKDATPGEPA